MKCIILFLEPYGRWNAKSLRSPRLDSSTAGAAGMEDPGVPITTTVGGGEIPGIFGILGILIDILGIPGIFNIPIRSSGAAPSMSPLRSLPRFPSKPPAPQTPIRQLFRRPSAG